MELIPRYRRLEARDQERRLRLPFALLAAALSVAVVLLGAWMLHSRTDDPTTWSLIVVLLGALAVSTLSKHVLWRLQRRVDGPR